MAGNQEKNSHEKKKMGCQNKSDDSAARSERKTHCRDLPGHQINQNLYYKWRDQFLGNMDQVFIDKEKIADKLTSENKHLRKIIGDLTVELKKTEEWLK
jgi:hypothetical protein